MKDNNPIFNKVLKEIAKEKDLTEEQLKSFLAKVALVESGTELDHTIKQIGGGPGRGIGQWETNEGKGSNRVVTSLGRANNYFKNKGQKTPYFIKKALEEVKEKGTYDMTNLLKDQQMLVLLSDFRMGNGDLKDLKKGNEFEMWRDHWWQGNEEDVPEKRKLWEEKNNYFKENKNKVFTKLYNKSSSQLQQSNETQIPFKNNASQNYNIAQNTQEHIDNTKKLVSNHFNNSKKDLNSYIKENNNQINTNQHIDRSKALVSDYFNNSNALGGFLGSGNSIKSKNLNEFNTGGLHEQNRLGGIPVGTGSNGKTNTVEEDETSFETKKGKFIFSNRIKIE